MFFFLVGSASVLAIAPQCGGGGSTDCTQTSTCPSDAADGPPPLNCNMSADPKDSLGCVDDRVGIFVSPMGSDMNPGTKEAPVQTIAKGLSIVGMLTRVYVCAGTYAENISLAPPADGISIYGGFKCADWSYSGTNRRSATAASRSRFRGRRSRSPSRTWSYRPQPARPRASRRSWRTRPARSRSPV